MLSLPWRFINCAFYVFVYATQQRMFFVLISLFNHLAMLSSQNTSDARNKMLVNIISMLHNIFSCAGNFRCIKPDKMFCHCWCKLLACHRFCLHSRHTKLCNQTFISLKVRTKPKSNRK